MYNDQHFMKLALEEAKLAQEAGDWAVGCVLVLDNQVIAKGRNKVYSSENKMYHAELDALLQVSGVLAQYGRETTLYVTYEPCPMCLGAILLNHIGRVVCGPDLDSSGGLSLLESMPQRFSTEKYRFELIQNCMHDECREVFLSGEPAKKLRL